MRSLAILICSGLLAACTTSPTGRSQLRFVPDSQLTQLGGQAYEKLKQKTPISRDRTATNYVNCVAGSIVREVGGGQSWEVTLFDKNTANAFALPGGKIGVYAGLLKVARTPAQLAAVVGHEVGHVLAGHSNERLSQQVLTQGGLQIVESFAGAGAGALGGYGAEYLILKPFGRTQESEADVIGLDIMAKAGFDPRESVELWRNMDAASKGSTPEFLSTHPSHGTRIGNLNSRMPQALSVFERARASGKRPSCG